MALTHAWEEFTEKSGHNLPLLGDNTLELAAEAALSVLLAVSDTQDYLRREGMLDDSH